MGHISILVHPAVEKYCKYYYVLYIYIGGSRMSKKSLLLSFICSLLTIFACLTVVMTDSGIRWWWCCGYCIVVLVPIPIYYVHPAEKYKYDVLYI